MRANHCVLGLLVVLTLGLFAAGGEAGLGSATLWVLPVAGLKAVLVGWQFMDLRTAHGAWKLGALLMWVVVFGTLLILGRPS